VYLEQESFLLIQSINKFNCMDNTC